MNAQLLRFAAVAGTVAAVALQAKATPITIEMPDRSVVSADEFRTFFVSSEEGGNPGNRDKSFQFDGADVDFDDVVLLEQAWTGWYPFGGPHQTFEPGYWEGHLDQLRRNVERFIPDPNYSGLVVLDCEAWRPLWERTKNKSNPGAPSDIHDQDFKDDWRDFARVHYADRLHGLSPMQQEAVFEETYEEAAREWFVRTIREFKRLRPNALCGYFMIPVKRYQSPETPHGVIGYGNLSYDASRLNDQLDWVADECDFLMPNIYPPKAAMPEGVQAVATLGQAPAWRNAEYIYSSVQEAVRMARGKPVYVIGSTNYWGAFQHTEYFEAPLTETSMEHQFEISRQAGASGLVLWHYKNTFPDSEFAPYLSSTLSPIAMNYGETALVDTDTELDDDTAPGGQGAPPSSGGNGDVAENDNQPNGGGEEELSPEKQAALDKERDESGKDTDEPSGDTAVFTRMVTTRTLTVGSKGSAAAASGSAKTTSRRTFTKAGDSAKKDESSKAGAPADESGDTKKADAEKKTEAEEREAKRTRTWVYQAKKDSDD